MDMANMAQVGELVNGLAEVGMDAAANISALNSDESSMALPPYPTPAVVNMPTLESTGAVTPQKSQSPITVALASPTLSKKSQPDQDYKKSFQPEPGFGLHQLEFSTVIGTGTFGRVLVCRHGNTGQYYALKILSIAEVIRLKQIEHVKNEKSILLSISHPFIVSLFWSYHDNTFLYMLLEYVAGGELFSYLRSAGRFNNNTATFYAAEIVTALDYLHNLNIVYRDLKPENLLLDKQGHIKITDFGFAKRVDHMTYTLCGTPEYLAPEIIQSKGHNRAVDWWALGILIYEMLAGYPPFFDDNPFAIYEKILQAKVEWAKHTDPTAKDIIKRLLVTDRTKRLGVMKNGTEDVKRHRWFKSIIWDDVVQRKLVPPIVPKVAHEGDTRCFDTYPDDDWHNRPAVGQLEQELFLNF